MYEFSTNPIKLARALGNLAKGATEEEVKAEYVRLGGFVSPHDSKAVRVKASKTSTTPKKKVVKKVAKKVSKKK